MDHKIHNDYQRPVELGNIRTYITNNLAFYVDVNLNKTQSIRSQHLMKDRPLLRDGNAKYLYLIYLNQCLELLEIRQDMNTSTKNFANAISEAVNAFTVKNLSKTLDAVRPWFTKEF